MGCHVPAHAAAAASVGEGGGPEHSSGRVERFLQAAAEGNIRIANCTTSAQYFHLLRRQAKWSVQRPLVVMTPKSLLRKKEAGSSLADLATGAFQTVLDDAAINERRASARALVLCSGKVYYDLLAEALKRGDERPPIARVEQLYPPPRSRVAGAALALSVADRSGVDAGRAAQHGAVDVHGAAAVADPAAGRVPALCRAAGTGSAGPRATSPSTPWNRRGSWPMR